MFTHRYLLGRLQDGFVAHEEGAHQLQDWNLEWKVKGRHQGDGSVGPTVSHTHLSIVVTRDTKRLGETTDIVAGKVVEKGGRHFHFTSGLGVRLGDALHNGAGKVVGDFGVTQGVSGLLQKWQRMGESKNESERSGTLSKKACHRAMAAVETAHVRTLREISPYST